jgi:ABC-type lipoprotein export system ATPase subunit
VEALHAAGLSKSILLASGDRLDLLVDASLSIMVGESVAIVGRSGCGKTTLLSILGLLSPPGSGTITIGGIEVTMINDAERSKVRNDQLGFVFQNYSLIAHLTAHQNVMLPLLYQGTLSLRAARSRATDVLGAVNLSAQCQSHPQQLSGGEQQRVAIARALVCGPKLVLADEPTGALDTETATQVLGILQRRTREFGMGLLLVTHDVAVSRSADRQLSLESGSLREMTDAV